MTFLSNLRSAIKEEHGKLDQAPFLQRYKTTQLSVTAHYLHLCQLLSIYKALELKLKDSTYANKMPENLRHLLSRSEQLEVDIFALEQFVPSSIRMSCSLAAEVYAKQLSNISDEHELFGHYLTRILGDLFGGQMIKSRIESQEHVSWQQFRAAKPGKGLSFYQFPEGTLKDIAKWLNEDELVGNNEAAILAGANAGIIAHNPIFAETEIRLLSHQAAKFRLHTPLFTCKELAASAITAATVALAVYKFS